MRVFVTGATGHIGSAVGARTAPSRASGHRLGPLGPVRGRAWRPWAPRRTAATSTISTVCVRRPAASDGVIHLAFNHDFSDFLGSVETDLRAVEAMGEALVGSGQPVRRHVGNSDGGLRRGPTRHRRRHPARRAADRLGERGNCVGRARCSVIGRPARAAGAQQPGSPRLHQPHHRLCPQGRCVRLHRRRRQPVAGRCTRSTRRGSTGWR